MNRYGVDTDYFKRELSKLSKSLQNRTAGELKRYLWRLADVAASQEKIEPENQHTTATSQN